MADGKPRRATAAPPGERRDVHPPRGARMTKSKRYREHAEECRALARNAPTEEQRRQLLELAESWGSLALDRERKAEKLLGSPNGGNE
jgi:hypothetical protein